MITSCPQHRSCVHGPIVNVTGISLKQYMTSHHSHLTTLDASPIDVSLYDLELLLHTSSPHILAPPTTWPRTPASSLPPGPSARPHARPCSRSWRGLSCELPGWRRCSVWLSHPCSGRLRPPSSSSLHSRTYASSGSCSYWRSWCYRVCKHFARLSIVFNNFVLKY